MKIAINTRLLLKNRLEGIGWFTYETLKRITKDHPEHQFYFIFDRKYDEEFIFSSNIEPVVVGPQARHPVLFYLWFEYALPFIFKKIKPDLFLSPDGYLSLSTSIKSINVIHDLNFEHYPGDLPAITRWHYRHFFPRYAKKADRIATVSEFSKQDIVSHYQIDPQKIDVVYNGANDYYEPLPKETIQRTKEEITGGFPYFIFIGALHPRKNLTNLFKSFDRFRKVYQSDIKLVIVGAKKWWTQEIRNTYENMEFREEVIFTGRLSADELKNALGSALALTYISYFEGFGIPIVEAFYCETPVITSNVTSMPEVAGDAAAIIDPFSVEDICQAMIKIASDEEFRNKLIQKGKERKKIFTWQKSADKLWETIEKAMAHQ